MTIKISIRDFAGKVEALGPELEAAALRGIYSAALRLEGMVVDSIAATTPYPPQDTGELSRSVTTTKKKNGATVQANAPHAPFMEYGTRPHFPPLQPLAEWAYRKGLADSEEEAMGVALAVARKIAKKGIAPRFFMKRAIEELERQHIVEKEIIHELKTSGLLT